MQFGSLLIILFLLTQVQGLIWARSQPGILQRHVYFATFLISAAMLSLFGSLLMCDFDLVYVANHSHTDLPWYYRLSALWGGHEGSYLLWLWLLNIWGVCSLNSSKDIIKQQAMWYLQLISLLMGCYLFFFSSPFEVFVPAGPENGADLNPLLQDPGMMIHPPVLYVGYVGFVIPMVYVLGYLRESGQHIFNISWMRQQLSYVVMWLTVGITLGSWWAYRELGWGGFWFWDPVENASLMPWLLGVAALHMAKVASVDRGKVFALQILALLGFVLSVLGSFLVRSGVLISVHTFASDPDRGFILLLILAFISMLCLRWIIKDRRHVVMHAQRYPKHMLFAYASSLLILFVLTVVLLGTLYPIFNQLAGAGTVSVGAEYFNDILTPVVLLSLALMCLLQVKVNHWQIGGFFCGLGGLIFYFYWPWHVGYGIVLGLIVFALVTQLFARISMGAKLAHIGFCTLLLGVTLHADQAQLYERAITVGKPLELGEHRLLLTAVDEINGQNYIGQIFKLSVSEPVSEYQLAAERRFYPVTEQVMSKTAITLRGLSDIYLNVADPIDDHSWSMRLYIKPGVILLWIAGALMAAAFWLVGRRQ